MLNNKERFIAAKERFQETLRKSGLCLDCRNPPSTGRTQCDACREERRAAERRRKGRAVNQGLCSRCCRLPKFVGNSGCEQCYLSDAPLGRCGTTSPWEELLDKFETQKQRCALSGRELTLGVDPKSTASFPSAVEGKGIANTQWVLTAMNRLKDNMLEGKLFDLIKSVYRTMEKRRRGKSV